MSKNFARLLIAAMLLLIIMLLLSGCGVSEGKVIDKQYEPARTERVWVDEGADACGIQFDGKYGCTPGRVIDTNSGHWEDEYHAAEYRLRLKDCSGEECKTGWVSVGKGVYKEAKLGDFVADGEIRN